MTDAVKDDEVVATAGPNFLEMSDEEINAFDPEAFQQAAAVADETDTASVDETAQETVEDAVEDAAEEEETIDEVTKQSDPQEASSKKPAAAVDDPAKEVGVADNAEQVDYKAAYERLTATFKANGRDIQVKNVDDAIALMQMGANYNKKMAGLKPNLKLMKMLESNGLLSEEKLSFLIDLDKKNPEAINKLVKDSGMDPLDLSAERASEYKPQTYTVDEREMELDAVLGELESSPAYNRTLDVVSTKWDGASKGVIASKPEILKVINAHMENGIYDLIATEIESERTFGRLNGLSDLEAYRQVGDSIQARGGFAHLGHQKQNAPNTPVIVQPKPKQVDDDRLRDKKRAASSTKTAIPTAGMKADFNPLSMSDEEFSKQATPKFL